MNEEEECIPISCGSLVGQLLLQRFLCPGIHQECILVDGQIVTPKMFCVMGDKEKLKDWKNAIRVNGKSIRRVMDTGQLDFANHSQHCTGRCSSRTQGIIGKYDSVEDAEFTVLSRDVSDREAEAHVVSSSTAVGMNSKLCSQPNQPQSEVTPGNSVSHVAIQADNQTNIDVTHHGIITPSTKHGSDTVSLAKIVRTVTMKDGRTIDESYTGASLSSSQKTIRHEDVSNVLFTKGFADDGIELEDSQVFWRGIVQVGIFDEIINEIKSEFDSLKCNILQYQARRTDAKKMSKIVQELNLMEKIKYKMSQQKFEVVKQNDNLLAEIEALKQKVQRSELMQQELKRKSESFDQLMCFTQPKRLCLQSPDSVDNSIPSVNTALNSSLPISISTCLSECSAPATSLASSTSPVSATSTVSSSNML